jgi:hypothetical protein
MRTALVIATLLLASDAYAQVYSAGVQGGYGTALVPPTSSGVTTTGITIREYGGIIGNLILFIGEAPAVSNTTVTYETDGAGNTYEVRTTYAPSAEVQQLSSDWMEARGRKILAGGMGQQVELDIPLRALGGDTSGVMFKMWRPLPFFSDHIEWLGESGSVWLAQFYIGHLTFSDVTSRKVSSENGILMSTEVTGEQSFTMIGSALRVQKMLTRTLRAQVQLDFNVFSILEDDPSPMHFGIETTLPHLLLRLEAVTSGFLPHGLSVNAEAVIAL